MSERSPRPWKVADQYSMRDARDIRCENGELVAIGVSTADAQLIVRAVNERDELRSALQLVTNEMCKYCRAEAEKNPQLAGKPCLDGCEPLRLARAALAEDGQVC